MIRLATGPSPFEVHRDKVLGFYGTASFLRDLVLSLWSGKGHPVGLSQVGGLDDEHFAIVIEMLRSYRSLGENDPHFEALAHACIARAEEERTAAERSEALDAWCSDVQRVVRSKGGRSGLVEDHSSWFEQCFDEGLEPQAAAVRAMRVDLDAERAKRRAED